MDPVLVERHDAVATVTLNRPDRRNSLTAEAKRALRDALTEVATEASVRAVVLTGAGGHFCVGQDLAEHADTLRRDAEHAFDTVAAEYTPVIAALTGMPKPVIAAVEGSCVGAGLAMALACDLLVLSEGARLATAFGGIGLTFDSGLSYTLPRAVGESRARRLVLLGETFSAADAVDWGVAATVTPVGEALATATACAAGLAAGPTAAYAETKRLLAETWDRGLAETLAAEGRAQARLGRTDDHAGAVRAFLAKQQPTFSGH
jgi:2-(1,2-epoxy-1,2-dihydrophenyl)acetyl-CoA isomerase